MKKTTIFPIVLTLMLLVTTAFSHMNYVSIKVTIDNAKCVGGKTVGKYTILTKENLRRFQHVPITFSITYEGRPGKHHSQTVYSLLPKSKSGKTKNNLDLPALDCTAPYPVKHVVIKSDRGGKKSFHPPTVYDIEYWHNMQQYGWEYQGEYFCRNLKGHTQCIWFSWDPQDW